ncbi:Gx transporter family protein [Clostridium sp. MB40-C1]|uniref:Gx transporter family protein n=1 Tax=Clostridium sp. MB40-C1 TaxID=3070996 RepID=UPI0027E1ED02|nr:Gx transporter family protein [Clostridium sp. MB40-C1]WMJ79936.1 Gx transporter family protein [Clostridium sp. MB40-C1]
MKKTQKLTFIALFVAQGLVLYMVERMIPVPFITPGAKLGLTNIVTLLALYMFDFKDVFLIIVLRVILSTLLGGTLSSFLYSIAGGMLSFIAMYVMKKIGKDQISIIGISIVGSVFHNIGQIIVAALVIENVMIVAYLPVLLIAALGTGFFVGLTSKYLFPFMKRITQN